MRQEYRKPEPIKLERAIRRCLMCGADFESEGPQNRICRRCQSSQIWRDGC